MLFYNFYIVQLDIFSVNILKICLKKFGLLREWEYYAYALVYHLELAEVLGDTVYRNEQKEMGWHLVTRTDHSHILFEGIGSSSIRFIEACIHTMRSTWSGNLLMLPIYNSQFLLKSLWRPHDSTVLLHLLLDQLSYS